MKTANRSGNNSGAKVQNMFGRKLVQCSRSKITNQQKQYNNQQNGNCINSFNSQYYE